MWQSFRVCIRLWAAATRAEAQYRANLIVWIVGGVAYQGVGFAFVWVILARFQSIGTWSLAEIAFLYGMRLTSHAMFAGVIGQLFGIGYIIRDGLFDRYLVRPISPLLQVLTGRVRLQVLGDIVGGVSLLAGGIASVHIDWTLGRWAYLAGALLGGALVEAALQVSISALAFRMLSVNALRAFIDGILTTFGGYPLSIFSQAARLGLTFVVPLAFIAYFPATVLLQKTAQLAVPAIVAACSPIIGLFLFVASLYIWKRESLHYSSSGH